MKARAARAVFEVGVASLSAQPLPHSPMLSDCTVTDIHPQRSATTQWPRKPQAPPYDTTAIFGPDSV
jgi:hypothetical protein